MGGWGETKLYIYDPYQDPRTAVINPIMTRLQQMRFSKMALAETLSGRAAFNKVFGGVQKANPLGSPPIFAPGVPCFGWLK